MADIIVSSPPPDYTSYYASIAIALETIATNSTSIKTTLASMKTDLDTMTSNSTSITTTLASMKTDLDTMTSNSTSIKTTLASMKTDLDTMTSNSTTITGLATGDGFHIVGPWEWLGFASIVKLLQDKGADFDALKAAVESLPKSY
jgi:hypothetical protein